MTLVDEIVVRRLGTVPYERSLQAMREFTTARSDASPDEIWIVQHPPVFTLGQGATSLLKAESLIPVVHSDRGGEITYHGPGQAVIYVLIDLARRRVTVKRFVWLLEQAVIDLVGPRAERRPGAPGVYVGGSKVAALGIRVKRGRAYHGLAVNVDMDLSPFGAIDPCGYPGLAVTQLKDLGFDESVFGAAERVAQNLIRRLEHA
ncbi:MAG TPA: lipoyl(octanoyl) transferase LipB [Burkholderiales bacterium]|nr:lipoyl(octanoyl) transferase LipB [Burkholderiales bacterium]